MAIPDTVRTNFNTLHQAFDDGNVCLLETTEKATGKVVYAICAISREQGDFALAPFGQMFTGDPFAELNPPELD